MKNKKKKSKLRLEARVSANVHTLVYKAAGYNGVTVSQFIIDAIVPKARNIVADYERIKLTDIAATMLLGLLENPPSPNTNLKKVKADFNKMITRYDN